MCQSNWRYWILFLPKMRLPSYPLACAASREAETETAKATAKPREARRRAERWDGRVKGVSFALLREEGACGLDFLLREDPQDAVFERQEVLEHPLQGVG